MNTDEEMNSSSDEDWDEKDLGKDLDGEDGSDVDSADDDTNTINGADTQSDEEDIGVNIKSVEELENDGIELLTGYDHKKTRASLTVVKDVDIKIIQLGVVFQDLPAKGLKNKEVSLKNLAILKRGKDDFFRALPLAVEETLSIQFLVVTPKYEMDLIKSESNKCNVSLDYVKWAQVGPRDSNVAKLTDTELEVFGDLPCSICLSTALMEEKKKVPFFVFIVYLFKTKIHLYR